MSKPSGFSTGFDPGFGVGRYYYGFAQYIWDDEGFWRLPASVVGAVDLRPVSAMAQPGGTPQGFAFVASLQPVDVLVSRCLNFQAEPTTSQMQDAWQAELGYRPQGANLVDLLWDQLTNGSDPDGVAGPRPLMAGVDQVLKLFVGGHSLVKSQRFNLLEHSPHADRVRTLLQRDYQSQHDHDPDHARRVLDYWCEKYRLDKRDKSQWQVMVPAQLRAGHRGPLPHATTLTDNFNRANESLDASGWTEYTTTGSNWSVTSNQCVADTAGSATAGGRTRARYDSDLSGDDHYCEVTRVSAFAAANEGGPAVRFNSAADSSYVFMSRTASSGLHRLSKIVSGTPTDLQTGSSVVSDPFVIKLEANGSSLICTKAGSEVINTTDTTFSGQTRCGLSAWTGSGNPGRNDFDDWSAADLGGGSSVAAVNQYQRRYRHLITRLLFLGTILIQFIG